MVKRLFLDRVYVHGTGVAIDQTVIFSIPVFPDPTKTSSAAGYNTLPRAELALNFTVF
jgi:hypothetical protein